METDIPQEDNVETTNKLELSPLTSEEMMDVFGVDESSNDVQIFKDRENDCYVLVKSYEDDKGEESAQRERDALSHLAKKNTKTRFSKLYSEDIGHDSDGKATIQVEMDIDYLAFHGDENLVDEIIEEDEPSRLTQIVEAVNEMHESGVKHGDLHLRNVGETPPEDYIGDDEVMIIDFEYAEVFDEQGVPEDSKIQDLARLGESLLSRFAGGEKQIARAKLLKTIESVYGESIDHQEMKRTLDFLLY